jgi:6-phosphogluconolactonase
MALSGGSTPALLFSILPEKYRDQIDWSKVKIFWVDERAVPPEDDQSNYKMTAETLLNHVSIPGENIFRVKGENDAEVEAIRYSQILRNTVPLDDGIPLFDIILLGIGEDGHTASIFPDQMELLKSDKICEKAVHPQSGQLRVTLTGSVINKGKSVYFLTCGEGKAEILRKIGLRDLSLPASHINNKGELFFFLDSAAASE